MKYEITKFWENIKYEEDLRYLRLWSGAPKGVISPKWLTFQTCIFENEITLLETNYYALSLDHKNTISHSSFKKYIREDLINEYNEFTCTNNNCYSCSV